MGCLVWFPLSCPSSHCRYCPLLVHPPCCVPFCFPPSLSVTWIIPLSQSSPSVQPDLVTYNTLLAACASRSLVDESAMVFRSLVASRVSPDMVSYSTLIDTHHRARKLTAVCQLFGDMALDEGVVADVAAYNLLIEAYGWSGDYQSATKVQRGLLQMSVQCSCG